jgi:ABC-type dipeptide/oligopeptide/nickel transport system ATPase subunit
MSQTTIPLIEAKNIHKNFTTIKGIYQALTDVSFSVYPGQTLGIVGESGSGKSTLGEIVGHLQAPTFGDILYEGRSIQAMNRNEYSEYRKNTQFIFQSPKESLNPFFTVKEAIEEPLIIQKKKVSNEKLEEVLDKVRLPKSYLNKRTMELSGGQAQRVAIARSLILRPKLIICDEITSALDVSVQAQILDLINDIQKDYGTAYLFITHDIGVVYNMSDEIIVLNDGMLEEQ